MISVILGSAADAASRNSSTSALNGITQLLNLLFSIAALRVDESANARTDTTSEDRSERRQVIADLSRAAASGG